MMPKACKTLTLVLVGLTLVVASGVQSSAVKGHHSRDNIQRVEDLEQTARDGIKTPPREIVKSAVKQSSERSPKSSSSSVQQASAPVLESSKKVYNDEFIRRSVGQQAPVVSISEPIAAVKSAPAPIVEPVPIVSAPVVPVVVEQQPQAPVAAPAVVQKEVAAVVPAVAQPQPISPVVVVAAPIVPVIEAMKPTFVAESQPSSIEAKSSSEQALPPQSERSAPIKDEAPIKPVEAVAAAAAPSSVVIVEQVVPAKVPAIVEQPQQAPVAIAKPVEPIVVEPIKPTQIVQADSPLMAKKDQEVQQQQQPKEVVAAAEAPIEVPAPDPGLVLSEPIDSTTKLLIDLDEHVQKFLPAEDKQEPAQPAKDQVLVSGVDYSPAAPTIAGGVEQPLPISGKSSVPLIPYSSSQVDANEASIVPPLPSLEKVEKASGVQSSPASAIVGGSAAAAASGVVVSSGQSATRQANNHHHQGQNQQQVITQLLDQLDSLQNRIQDTINQLVARRRYVMSALLRPMGTYVRRVRTNLERLQNRVNQLQAAAVSVGGGQGGQNRPGGFVDAAAIETIRRRIDDISKRISDIVNRIRFSLTPTSAPLNSNGRK